MKKCSRCKVPKDNKEFYRRAVSADGLFSECKECSKEVSMIRRDKKQEERKLWV